VKEPILRGGELPGDRSGVNDRDADDVARVARLDRVALGLDGRLALEDPGDFAVEGDGALPDEAEGDVLVVALHHEDRRRQVERVRALQREDRGEVLQSVELDVLDHREDRGGGEVVRGEERWEAAKEEVARAQAPMWPGALLLTIFLDRSGKASWMILKFERE
jgi:hypothetical protein